jgi:hypothetical protein
MKLFVIYRGVSDRRGPFVVREWKITDAGNLVPESAIDVDTLEEARCFVPVTAICIDRHPTDDPCIVEVWL